MAHPQGKTATNLVAIIQNLLHDVPNGRQVKSFKITGYTQEGENQGDLVLPILEVSYEDADGVLPECYKN